MGRPEPWKWPRVRSDAMQRALRDAVVLPSPSRGEVVAVVALTLDELREALSWFGPGDWFTADVEALVNYLDADDAGTPPS